MAGQTEGFDALAAKLRGLTPAMRKKVLRNALAAGARLVRDTAKRAAPELQPENKTPYRKRGTVRKAIKVRTSKQARRDGDVGVFVNVKPLKKAQVRAFKAGGGGSGFKNPDDPYYWQWLEFGRQARGSANARQRVARVKRDGVVVTKGVRYRRALRTVGGMAPFGFLRKGAQRLNDALGVFNAQVVRWIDKVNSSGKVQP